MILSCHDEFHYAQAAVKLSVSEYILKETMNVSNITEVLIRLKEQLDAEDRQQSKSRKLEKEVSQQRSASKRQFIRSTVNEPLFDAAEWSTKAGDFGIQLNKHAVLPVFGYANRVKEANSRFQSTDLFEYTIQNIVEELLVDQKEVTLFTYDTGEIVLLFPHFSELHVNNSQKMEQTLRQLQSCLQKYAKISFSFITGTPVKDVRLLKDQLIRMVEAKAIRFYMPESSISKLEHLREGFGDGGSCSLSTRRRWMNSAAWCSMSVQKGLIRSSRSGSISFSTIGSAPRGEGLAAQNDPGCADAPQVAAALSIDVFLGAAASRCPRTVFHPRNGAVAEGLFAAGHPVGGTSVPGVAQS